ncbi:glutathione S-transferase 1-like [Calliphora vicina]|uniref:glutathione S-transferase 1-like n=1 Tax=Calliphora vicina TaxID=7373 RepID=UPI00325BAA32
MTKITLYGFEPSPPVRACLLTLKALQLPFKYVHIDLMAGGQMSEDFLKKNPQHTVPTLEDGGHFISDSHAIITYLVSKYAKDDSLYPKDFLKRALVDQRLHFEGGVAYYSLYNISAPLWRRNENQVPREKIDAIVETYNFLEIFLKDSPYMAGNHLTIADFSIVAIVTSLQPVLEIDTSKYPKLMAWLNRMETLPYYHEANGVGAQQYSQLIKSKNITII